jgi:predicted dehydrogenase
MIKVGVMEQVRWGIIGCGQIAHTFAKSIEHCQSASLLAVASTSPQRARSFAEGYKVRACASYAEIMADPEIDALYIATTHEQHFPVAAMCLSQGKHVLCEKPITVNAAQLERLIALAAQNHCFLMEGVWMRFLPAISRLKSILKDKLLGDVHSVSANFSLAGSFTATHRLMDKEKAGGALLDLGIYPISLASLVFARPPVAVQSLVYKSATGVDERGVYLLDYGQGQVAQLSSALQQHGPTEACIMGSKGYLRLPDFVGAKTLELHIEGQEIELINLPFTDDENFCFEIEHASQNIKQGKLQSPILPLSESLNVMSIMDKLRVDWQLAYSIAIESTDYNS